APALAVPDERPRLDQRTDELLEEEWVPLAYLEQVGFEPRRQRVGAHVQVQQIALHVLAQGLEGEFTRAMWIVPPGALSNAPRTVVALHALRDREQERRALGHRQEPFHELDRARIGPVQVLERDDHGPVGREEAEKLADDLERAVLERLRRQVGRAGRDVVL